MDMSDTKNKPSTGSVRQKKLEKDADGLSKKEFFMLYSAFAAFANVLEEEKKRFPTVKTSRTLMLRQARRRQGLPKHLDRAIIEAETYSERDLLCRRLASQCYRLSQQFTKNSDYKQAVKWMNLALRFLRLSLDPKAKQMDEKFEAELDELKAAMKKREEEEEEEDEEG
jgi:hypothetical protein